MPKNVSLPSIAWANFKTFFFVFCLSGFKIMLRQLLNIGIQPAGWIHITLFVNRYNFYYFSPDFGDAENLFEIMGYR